MGIVLTSTIDERIVLSVYLNFHYHKFRTVNFRDKTWYEIYVGSDCIWRLTLLYSDSYFQVFFSISYLTSISFSIYNRVHLKCVIYPWQYQFPIWDTPSSSSLRKFGSYPLFGQLAIDTWDVWPDPQDLNRNERCPAENTTLCRHSKPSVFSTIHLIQSVRLALIPRGTKQRMFNKERTLFFWKKLSKREKATVKVLTRFYLCNVTLSESLVCGERSFSHVFSFWKKMRWLNKIQLSVSLCVLNFPFL